MKKSILDGAWTQDTFMTRCKCGQEVKLLRRGRLVKIPSWHDCPWSRSQQGQIRTIRVIETVVPVTREEARRRLDSARLGEVTP